ncbi:hypothetical protein COV18_03870 [Candidatus Woesearchaeota archaeon CG10_big_fil_rev_8_21_14_0_10_37_12]|nr:MAG: hypothetical protein COV18_03870 [Candidatus Woesearchaeota archaeon CG10_big_fil_rev_8_21_14_0_10_37_12]
MSFGLALGIICAIAIFLTGTLAGIFQKGFPIVNAIAEWYIGYAPTLLGSIIGAMYAFVDGFIGGTLFAWIYNKLQN